MKLNFRYHVLLVGLITLLYTSCEKLDNEFENPNLNNPFDKESGIELMVFDSVQKFGGSLPYLKCYFHLNAQVFTNSDNINRVIVYRNGVETARLSPGNFTQFTDINSIFPGGEYNYQLSLLMKDTSYTKKTQPFLVVY